MARTTRDRDFDTIREDLAALKKTIETLANDFNRAGDSALDQAGERLGETIRKLRAQLSDVTDRGRRSAESVTSTVSERPVQSLMIAFAAGMIIAQVLKRR